MEGSGQGLSGKGRTGGRSEARGEYKKSMEQMQDKAEEARNLAEKVRGANEEAWKDMVGASQKAFVELQRGWADAVSRFQ